MSSSFGNRLRTVGLLVLLTLIIMVFGDVLGGSQGLKIAFVLAMLMNLGAWWFSADLVLAQSKARVVGPAEAPELYELVAHLAERAGLPVPRVAIVDDPAPNAFATGRSPSSGVVAVTTGLLSLMNREELAGVLAHELTHIKNRDILVGSVAAVLAGVIMLLASAAKFGFMFLGQRGDGENGGNPIAALVLAIVAPVAAMLIQAAISRSREYLADDGGADIAGTPYGLASALEKLSTHRHSPQAASPNTAHMYIANPLGRTMSNLFATHPPIEERIARLRGQIL